MRRKVEQLGRRRSASGSPKLGGQWSALIWTLASLMVAPGGAAQAATPGPWRDGRNPIPWVAREAGQDTLARWFSSVRYDRELISSDLPQWVDWSSVYALLIRDFQAGALGVELAQVERFGYRDRGVTVDGYRTLWNRSYGNLRLRVNPGSDVLPKADLRLEWFQGLPGGWEPSVSYWRMDFDKDDVDLFGLGLARYVGNWYLREVTSVSRLSGHSALSFSVSARRFLNPPREYWEVSGGIGQEAVVLGPGPEVEVRKTRFLRASLQKFLSARWGYSAATAYNRFEGAPERWGVSLGIISRF